MIHITDYDKNGYFKCPKCGYPVFEGDEYLIIDGERICRKCIEKEFQTATFEDSDYKDYINRETHERIDSNGR